MRATAWGSRRWRWMESRPGMMSRIGASTRTCSGALRPLRPPALISDRSAARDVRRRLLPSRRHLMGSRCPSSQGHIRSSAGVVAVPVFLPLVIRPAPSPDTPVWISLTQGDRTTLDSGTANCPGDCPFVVAVWEYILFQALCPLSHIRRALS
mgnify:CR=1 FL=1